MTYYEQSKLLAFNGRLLEMGKNTFWRPFRQDGGGLRYTYFTVPCTASVEAKILSVPNYILHCPLAVDKLSCKVRRLQRWFKSFLRRKQRLALAMSLVCRLGKHSAFAVLSADCVQSIAFWI